MKWQHLGGLVALGLGMLAPGRAIAADEVVLTYGIVQRSVAVEELSALAQEGEVSRSLKSYFEQADVTADDVREVLTDEVAINGVMLERNLNNVLGDALLDRVSEVIYPEPRSSGRGAMRAALVLSAVDDDRISLIEVLENYPTSVVYVDGNRLETVYNDITAFQAIAEDVLDILDLIDEVIQ